MKNKISKDKNIFLSLRGHSNLALVILLGLFFRFFYLDKQIFTCDEGSIVSSLKAYFLRGFYPVRNWHHPPFRYFFFYFSSRLFGENPFAYRLPSALFAVFSLVLCYLLARKFFESRVALLASLFLAIDPLHTAFSRLAFEESQLTFFILLSLFLAFKYAESRKPMLLLALGISLGLGMGTKWLFFPVYLFIFIYLLLNKASYRQPILILLLISTLIILPLATYELTFIPWLKRGFTFLDWLDFNLRMAKSVTSVSVVDYGDLIGRNSNAFFWFIYPLSFSYRLLTDKGFIISVTAFTLPFFWNLLFPALIYLFLFKKNNQIIYFSLPFLMFLAPLIFTTRPIFLYSATPLTPFVVITVSAFLNKLGEKNKYLKKLVVSYIIIVIFLSLYLFPLEVSYPVPQSVYQPIFNFFWQ